MPDGNQVLVTKEWDDDDEKDKITQRVFYSDLNISMDIGYKSETAMNEAFDAYDQTKAEICLKAVKVIIPNN